MPENQSNDARLMNDLSRICRPTLCDATLNGRSYFSYGDTILNSKTALWPRCRAALLEGAGPVLSLSPRAPCRSARQRQDELVIMYRVPLINYLAWAKGLASRVKARFEDPALSPCGGRWGAVSG